MMKIVIVTGGIGSGKSVICGLFHDLSGCPVYEADKRVKELYISHPSLLDDIETELRESYRSSDGQFVPARLAERLFTDPDALNVVEKLVFPVLMNDFESWIASHDDSPFVLFESATVLEKPLFNDFGDFVILVDAPYEMRLERAVRRDSSSREKVIQRMNNQKYLNQLSEGKMDSRIDVVLKNDDTLEVLKNRIIDIINRIK